jgi:hypothetical protein
MDRAAQVIGRVGWYNLMRETKYSMCEVVRLQIRAC